MATVHAHPRMRTPTREYIPAAGDTSSPTLTNPDMILPYREDYSSTQPFRSSPTLELTHNPSSSHRNGLNVVPPEPPIEVGVAKSFTVTIRAKPLPATTVTIPHHGYEHGAPLSVIGEEDTTPKSSSVHNPERSPGDPTTPTNTTLSTHDYTKRLSNRSESSTSGGSDVVDWEDFEALRTSNPRLEADLAKDEEENADNYGNESKRSSGLTVGDDDMKRAERILANAKKRLTKMEDNLSKARTSILISPKSSPIMGEHQPAGGLYRSISLSGDRRLGQGAHHRKSKPLYPVIKTMTAGHSRVLSETSVPSSSVRLSQTPVIRSASALDYSPEHSIDAMLYSHSSNAFMQSESPSSARSFNTPLKALQEEDGSPSSTNKTSPENPLPHGLGITSHPDLDQDLALIKQSNGTYVETPLSRSISQSSNRSARELRDQMIGLKSKIVDLKARAQADNLRRRSLHNLRAPSPFNQAPEQWYAAAAEYKAGESPLSANAGLGWSPQQEHLPEPRTPSSPMDTTLGVPPPNGTPMTSPGAILTDVNTPNLHQAKSRTRNGYVQAGSPEQPSHYEDAFEDASSDPEDAVAESEEEQVYLNEALEESLQEAEPEFSSMSEDMENLGREPERHEDRFDAFDYENMFLHSALGNYSQTGFQHQDLSSNSEDSDTSEISVETAKAGAPDEIEEEEDEEDEDEDEDENDGEELLGLVVQHARKEDEYATLGNRDLPTPTAPRPPWVHTRTNSMDSVSSVATFATATEGGNGSETESDTIPQEILKWGNRPSILNSFGGFPSPPSTSPILGMQSRSSRKGNSPLVTSTTASEPGGNAEIRRPGASVTLPASPEESPKDPEHRSVRQGQQSSSRQLQYPANTDVLMASLITLADPTFKSRSLDSLTGTSSNMFTDVDKDLVLALLKSVGAVCSSILVEDSKGEVYESRIRRRRLDAARRVLAGEIDVEEA